MTNFVGKTFNSWKIIHQYDNDNFEMANGSCVMFRSRADLEKEFEELKKEAKELELK